MEIELGGLIGLLLLGFWIWAILDVISTDADLCRNLPKGVWLILVLILPDIGSICWVLVGRPEKAPWRPGATDFSARRRPIAYEDQPHFDAKPEIVTDRRSRELDRRLDEWEAEQRAKQAELDRRESELRERELALREREIEKREREID